MRRLLLALAPVACVLAVAAAPAPAHGVLGAPDEFIGSEAAEPRFTGTGSQEFSFGPFTVSCGQARSADTGSVPEWPSQSLFAELKLSGCRATAKLHGSGGLELKAKFLTPIELNLNADGFVEAGAGGKLRDGKLEGAGAIAIALSGAVRCTIDVQAGTFPAKAVKEPGSAYLDAGYKPEEFKLEKGKEVSVRDKLAITTALSKMSYDLEGGFCETLPKTEGRTGAYEGGLLAELPKGSLNWTLPLLQSSDFATPTGSGEPLGITVGPEANLWFTEGSAGRIGEISPLTHATSDFATPTPASVPDGITVGQEGNLWFTELGASRIGEINPATHVTTDFATPTPSSQPSGITVGPEGNLWFTERTADRIGEINPVTHAISEFATPTTGGYPTSVTVGPEGNLWFTEPFAQKIGEINPVTHAISEFAAPTPSSVPFGITAGPEGNLWFTDTQKGKIGEFNPATHAGSEFAIPAPDSTPEVIVVGPEGDLWFTDGIVANAIGEINPVTHASSVFEATSADIPFGITAGPDGNMWFTEELSGRVGEVGVGASAASIAPPAVIGGGQAGVPQTCEDGQWSSFAFQQPLSDLFAFDGVQWLLNGAAIAGQNAATFTPTAGEAGDALSCTETATYPLTHVTAAATSGSVTVTP